MAAISLGSIPDRDRVAVVNEALARTLATGQPFLREQIQFGRSELTVIGIVEDTPDTSLRQPAHAFVYVPLAQTIGTQFVFGRLTILARARSTDPAPLIPAVREAVWAFDRNIVIDEVATMHERLAAAVRTERDSATLFGMLAVIALLVAVAGVYFAWWRIRSRSGLARWAFGLPFGATNRQVIGEIVVRESAWPIALGILIGPGRRGRGDACHRERHFRNPTERSADIRCDGSRARPHGLGGCLYSRPTRDPR